MEVLYNPTNHTIYHFKYSPKQLGPLPATRKDLLALIHGYLKNEIDVDQFTNDIAI